MASKTKLILDIVDDLIDEARQAARDKAERMTKTAEAAFFAHAPIKTLTKRLVDINAQILKEKEAHTLLISRLETQMTALREKLEKLGVTVHRSYYDHKLQPTFSRADEYPPATDYLTSTADKLKHIKREADLAIASARQPELLAIVGMVKEALRELED